MRIRIPIRISIRIPIPIPIFTCGIYLSAESIVKCLLERPNEGLLVPSFVKYHEDDHLEYLYSNVLNMSRTQPTLLRCVQSIINSFAPASAPKDYFATLSDKNK